MTITMNRPQRMNALTGQMLIRMYDAFVEASESPDIRCIVLTGAGGNFCSGADLRAMSGDAPADPLEGRTANGPDGPIVRRGGKWVKQ
jgi:enoyl-CoA hydratase